MKILNYGSLNYDYVYTVPHIAAEGETISAEGMECHLGGKGLNQSVAIARAGSRVYQGGAAGSDGDRFFEFCAANGVSTEFIERMEGACGCAFIQVDSSSENCIVLYSGTNKRQSREHIDQVLESFEEGDLLILQNEINELPYLIDRAYERGMRIVLNPSPYNSQVEESDLNKIEFFLLNEVEGEQISGSREPEKILSYMKRRFPEAKVVLTLGSQGAVYQDSRQKICQPAFPAPAVDTTAAGDTFTGYFIHGIACQDSVRKSLESAAKAAAIAVSRKGAADSIPWAGEVEAFGSLE
ncbi:MAG TPA: ribokinase [Candidatus Scatomonas merdigallinarum]|nr:ribokinase [Candidatus Scatomonas merdigallinarum]